MPPFEMFLLALALGMDAFSVAVGVGLTAFGRRQIFRLSWHFGFFQFAMPLIGWQAARYLSSGIGTYGVWVGAGLLLLVGARMIREGLKKKREEAPRVDPTRGWSLVVLSTATSIDALAVGFGLGLAGDSLLPACVLIGITAGSMTCFGMILGRTLAARVGTYAETAGGVVLVLLAVRMLMK